MQVFFRENIALLAVPKTGSSACEAALAPFADIVFTGRRKHVGAGFYMAHVAPFLQSAFRLTPERVALIRDPLDHMHSWYRYRARPSRVGTRRSTADISFDDFLDAAIQQTPPPFADVGSQARFLTAQDGSIPVHHLFAYEAWESFHAFLEDRFGRPLTFERLNVSPPRALAVSPEAVARFRSARSADFALHEKVMRAGGHLHQLLDE